MVIIFETFVSSRSFKFWANLMPAPISRKDTKKFAQNFKNSGSFRTLNDIEGTIGEDLQRATRDSSWRINYKKFRVKK